MYRRQFLCRGLIGAMTAVTSLALRPARSQNFPKLTKEQASYLDNASQHTCAECTLFIPSKNCQVVQGPISETGTCIYFSH
jgi:hypothetical protein